jgi:hypothetical protein
MCCFMYYLYNSTSRCGKKANKNRFECHQPKISGSIYAQTSHVGNSGGSLPDEGCGPNDRSRRAPLFPGHRPVPSASYRIPAPPNPIRQIPILIPSAPRATPPRDGQLIKARCLRTAPHHHPGLRRLPSVDPPPQRARAIRSPHYGPRRAERHSTQPAEATAHWPQKERERPEARRRSGFPETPPLSPCTGRPSAPGACVPRGLYVEQPPPHVPRGSLLPPHACKTKSSGLTPLAVRTCCAPARTPSSAAAPRFTKPGRSTDRVPARPLAALRRDPFLPCSCSRPCSSAQPKAGGARRPPASLVPVWCF